MGYASNTPQSRAAMAKIFPMMSSNPTNYNNHSDGNGSKNGNNNNISQNDYKSQQNMLSNQVGSYNNNETTLVENDVSYVDDGVIRIIRNAGSPPRVKTPLQMAGRSSLTNGSHEIRNYNENTAKREQSANVIIDPRDYGFG